MTAKEANAKYVELQEMISPNYRSVLDVWQRNMAVDIPKLIGELRSKEKKANFRLSVLLFFFLILALMSLVVLHSLVVKSYDRNSLLYIALGISSLTYLITMIWERFFLKAIGDRERASTSVYCSLFELGRDLCHFKESDFANGYVVDSNTLGGAILYTALGVVGLQNRLLSLSTKGSILANLDLVAKGSSDLIELNKILDQQISSAEKFGKLFDRGEILKSASKI